MGYKLEKVTPGKKGTDKMTSLPNRESLEKSINNIFNEGISRVSQGEDCTHSVIMFDMDYFKSINDIYSHNQGDSVLKTLGHILKQYQKNEEVVCLMGRWGGEEFLMVLPYDAKKRAKYVADEIRGLVSSYSFPDAKDYKSKKTLKEKITLSMGVDYIDLAELVNSSLKGKSKQKPLINLKKLAKLEGKVTEEISRAINNANIALDYAKFMGRDRVEIFCQTIEREMKNLELVRRFYFENSFRKPYQIKELCEEDYLKENPKLKGKIKKHFYIIRTEINPRDTRMQAVFADNLYKQVFLSRDKKQKKSFMKFIKTHSNAYVR